MSQPLISPLAAVALVAAGSLAFAQGAPTGEGDHPSFDFRQPLINGKGVTSLADFAGKPVLVEFWGTH